MRNHNSHHVSFYADALERIHLDMVSAILSQNEIDRDAEEIQHRSHCEGMHFLTVVLPALGKSIDVSLATGAPLETKMFKLASRTKLPCFMLGLFRRVFRDDGVPWFATWYHDFVVGLRKPSIEVIQRFHALCGDNSMVSSYYPSFWQCKIADHWAERETPSAFPGMHTLREVGLLSDGEADLISVGGAENPCLDTCKGVVSQCREAAAVALRGLRQVCYSFYKLKLPYTDEQETKTLVDFVETDRALGNLSLEALAGPDGAILSHARRLIGVVLANCSPLSGIPRHGPGAVATGEKSSEKHLFTRYYRRLDSVFKYDEWFFCNNSHVCDSIQELQSMESLEFGTAKVVLVPKDSRGPRLISCEPLEYQWVQQSLMRVLVDAIENHPLTCGRVNFANQQVNRELALAGSLTFEVVTLDMKEASDRVGLELVRALFPPLWFEALYASRTPQTQLPDGRIVPLNKFAPMGSAVCFPVEALVFWALSVSGIALTNNLPLREVATKVFVYGDDIVVDAKHHGVINNTLPKFGLMLNERKCCTAGPFKESCGMDAYFGHPVTPTRLSSVWVTYPEPSMLASYIAYSNAFYAAGHFAIAEYLEVQIQWIFRSRRMRPVPTVSSGEPSCLAFVREHERPIPKNRALGCRIRTARKGEKDFHRHEVEGYRLESKSLMTKTEGWPLLLRKLTELETKNRFRPLDEPGTSTLPTGQYPIAHRVRLKRAWTPLV